MQMEIPLACNLTGGEYTLRESEIRELFASCQQVRELRDGYTFQFPGENTWAQKLMDFIMTERACCPFFSFELHLEANKGSIWLSIQGQAGVKEIVKHQFLNAE